MRVGPGARLRPGGWPAGLCDSAVGGLALQGLLPVLLLPLLCYRLPGLGRAGHQHQAVEALGRQHRLRCAGGGARAGRVAVEGGGLKGSRKAHERRVGRGAGHTGLLKAGRSIGAACSLPCPSSSAVVRRTGRVLHGVPPCPHPYRHHGTTAKHDMHPPCAGAMLGSASAPPGSRHTRPAAPPSRTARQPQACMHTERERAQGQGGAGADDGHTRAGPAQQSASRAHPYRHPVAPTFHPKQRSSTTTYAANRSSVALQPPPVCRDSRGALGLGLIIWGSIAGRRFSLRPKRRTTQGQPPTSVQPAQRAWRQTSQKTCLTVCLVVVVTGAEGAGGLRGHGHSHGKVQQFQARACASSTESY